MDLSKTMKFKTTQSLSWLSSTYQFLNCKQNMKTWNAKATKAVVQCNHSRAKVNKMPTKHSMARLVQLDTTTAGFCYGGAVGGMHGHGLAG